MRPKGTYIQLVYILKVMMKLGKIKTCLWRFGNIKLEAEILTDLLKSFLSFLIPGKIEATLYKEKWIEFDKYEWLALKTI